MAREIPKRILLINTEQFSGGNLASKLSKAGFGVAQASSHQEGALLLDILKVDMVILGHVSEESLEMCYQLHSLFRVPVIMIGRHSGKEIWGKALLESKAEFYLRSPFSMDLLICRIKAILRRYLPRVPQAAINPI